jgi:DUF917 family protein
VLIVQLRTEEDFEDVIIGAKILGCGGGGEASLARERINFILEQGLKVKVIDPKDVPDEAVLCVSGMVGGRASPECLKQVEDLDPIIKHPMVAATKLLQDFLEVPLHTLISTEIGAGNFLVPIMVSAQFGINMLDGDLCGRAKPEISISTSNVAGLSITPLAIASQFGDEVILKDAITDQRAETIARNMAVISGGSVGVARCPHTWKEYKKAAIPNTLSQSKNLGTALREARASGSDPIISILQAINGIVLFTGKIKQFIINDEGGFVIGHVIITNEDKDQFKVWFKNEYLVTWKNDKPFVSSPDLICIVDKETGEGLTPWGEDFTRDREVVVLGGENAAIWYTKKGLEIFGPKHFGYDWEYQPIKDLTK